MNNSEENRTIGSVALKIGVKAEPSKEFCDIAWALGFVRVVPCSDCVAQDTPDCVMKDDAKYVAFCSNGRERL